MSLYNVVINVMKYALEIINTDDRKLWLRFKKKNHGVEILQKWRRLRQQVKKNNNSDSHFRTRSIQWYIIYLSNGNYNIHRIHLSLPLK